MSIVIFKRSLGTNWPRIPFERALDFANKEKITELLYPLFVHNIGALLYHPTNQSRTNAVMAAAERRKQEQHQLRNSQTPGLPSMQSHHHHSMHNSVGSTLPGPQHAIAPHPGIGRPDIQRSHTFPTPPTSASSVMGSMGTSDGSFQWGGQPMNNVQGANPLAIDTGLSSTRSMPTTPATTPPGTSIQNMQQYQQGSQQPYDASRQMYSAPPAQQNTYSQANGGQHNMARYGANNSYIKNEMGPPSGRAQGPGQDVDHHDSKIANGLIHHGTGNDQVGHGQDEEEAEHEHDGEYTHDNNSAYDSSRGPYNYAPGPPVGSMAAEHSHLSPEMTGSPNHQAGSGRATPRTSAAPQTYYTQQQGGYSTPPRAQPPSSNLYNVMSSERGTANGGPGSEVYAPHSDIGNSMNNGYGPQQPVVGGLSTNGKRGREEDDDQRPSSRGPNGLPDDGLKRRKTINGDSAPGIYNDAAVNRPRAAISQRRR